MQVYMIHIFFKFDFSEIVSFLVGKRCIIIKLFEETR